jgi:hypothetical protein
MVYADELQFSEPQAWALVRQLLPFDAVIAEVEKELRPNRLCSDPFELSQMFNRFYDQVPVLKADGPARRSYLALCRLRAVTLKLGLGLLWIPSLEWMGGWGVDELRLRFLGHQTGILPNSCSRVLHGLATVGLTLKISSGVMIWKWKYPPLPSSAS